MNWEEAKSRLERILAVHDAFLDGAASVQNAVPKVVESRGQVNWHLKVVTEARSTGAPYAIPAALSNQIEYEGAAVDRWPAVPIVDFRVIEAIAPINSGGSTSYVDYYMNASQTNSPDAVRYRWACTQELQSIQKDQNRSHEVREGLTALGRTDLVDTFDAAAAAVQSTTAGLIPRPAAGTDARNLLWGVRSELERRARRNGEQKTSWQMVVDRLGKGQPGSPEHASFHGLEEKYDRLYSQLSNVTKRKEERYIYDLPMLWTLTLDLVSAILGHIDWSRGPQFGQQDLLE